MTAFTESVVEQAALAWLESAGWRIAHGPDIAPDMPAAELARRLAEPRRFIQVVAGARQVGKTTPSCWTRSRRPAAGSSR